MRVDPTTPDDVPALQVLLDQVGLFPSDLLPEMLARNDGAIWLTAHGESGPVGFCFTVREQLADGTWNMLALGVHPDFHRNGTAMALCNTIEDLLRDKGQRLLIVDTSGTNEFAGARAFYTACGYEREAQIRDFWGPGDDKITFRKRL